MRIGRIEGCGFERCPVFATTRCRLCGGPIYDGLLMIAELVQNSCMFDEDHLERWCMARNLVGKNLETGDATFAGTASIVVGGWE
jgi:hypothetical protein